MYFLLYIAKQNNDICYCLSLSSNGSPHSGQSFGGFALFFGSHPHLSHMYCNIPSALGFQHPWENIPIKKAPQEHVQSDNED
jgi:hypothetical protein